jgi:uncharacterized peroxidase-related enzyme
VGLAIIDYAASTGALRELYDRMLERPLPPVYRPAHGGVPGIIAAHSLDPELIGYVFSTSTTLIAAGSLTWPERELVSALTSRLNQCLYSTACHAEFLRVALDGGDDLGKAIVADPRGLATSLSNPRQRALAELTIAITDAPWTLSRAHRERAHTASLSDEDILHLVALTSHCGHLNRIADVTGIAVDYSVALVAPPPDPAVPALPTAPELVNGRPAIELSRRPATHAALAQWRRYIFHRDTPITRRQRVLLARWVATWLGDGSISPPTDLTVNPHDDALRSFAEQVTLAPWQIGEAHLEALRDIVFDDAAIFDVTATITSAGVFSRIEVAHAALGT